MKLLLRTFQILAIACAFGVLAAGCDSGDPGPNSGGSLSASAQQQVKDEYERSMGRVAGTLDDTETPFQMAVDRGMKNELNKAALRWDLATDLAAKIKPPADIQADHRNLVAAMRLLGKWNHKIANAAPNKKRTKLLSAQAQNSKASKDFKSAIDAISTRGYQIMGQGETPLDNAGTP